MKNRKHRNSLFIILLIFIPIITALIAMLIGRMSISPANVFSSILHKLGFQTEVNVQVEKVLWTMRFPRILLALLVGAGLSVAGCTFQSLFSNPLATPDTLGVASGAGFGAALAILLGFGMVGIQITAFLCGISAVVLTYLSGMGKTRSLNSMVLAGIMISSLFNALISFTKFVADTDSELPVITYFLLGGLDSAGYDSLKLGAPVILIGILIIFLLRWRLNILPLSEDEARACGINIQALRMITVVCATGITASCVSMCGQVGWVGLLIPHICRMKYGNNHLYLIPASISVGASFMVIVDTIARSATASEIPISVLTAMIGAPFFIVMLRRSGGWQV